MALAYDWLHAYPAFDDRAKAALRQKLQPLAENALKVGNDHVFHNYTWMFNSGAMLWALATVGEDPAAERLYAALRQRFNGQLFRAMEYLEGSNGDAAGYWWRYCQHYSLMVLLATQSAFETDVVGTIRREQGDWLGRQLDYLVLSVLPDMRFMPWGDIVAGANGGVTHEMAGRIDALTWALQSPHGAYLSRWLAEKRGLDRFYDESAIFYFLYTRNLAVKPVVPPLAMLAGGKQGGHVIMRSDWSDGATVVGFRSTDYFGQHLHLDQGSFVIFRNGLLALDAGTYRRVGGEQARTDAHNTLLLGGQGQRPEHYQSASTLEAFTERLGKGLETGDIVFYKDAGPWTAVAGQFAQAYSPQVIQSCVRQLLFVRPGVVVIVDRLAAPEGKSLPEVRWLLQVPGRAGRRRTSSDRSEPQELFALPCAVARRLPAAGREVLSHARRGELVVRHAGGHRCVARRLRLRGKAAAHARPLAGCGRRKTARGRPELETGAGRAGSSAAAGRESLPLFQRAFVRGVARGAIMP